MAEIAETYSFELDVQIRKDVDRELYQKENVITSDSIILDHCKSWINLTAECMKRRNQEGIWLGGNKFESSADAELSNCAIGADAPGAAFGKTTSADFASVRNKDED